MILGTAAGLPVVACVATRDRWGHVLVCPFCGEAHRHGGHGPTSPAGAINDARMAHCWLDGDRGHYVLFEVPGYTGNARSDDGMRVLNTVTYELDRMKDLDQLLAEFTAYYEQVWTGLRKRGPMRPGFNYQPMLDGRTSWGYAYRGAGPVRPGTQPFPDRKGRAREVQRFWRFIEERAADRNWLAEDIAKDSAFPAEALNFDRWAEHLGAFADEERWEGELADLWDSFRQGERSRQRIEISKYVHMLVDSWRDYCIVLVDRDGFGGLGDELPDEVQKALTALEKPTLDMFRRIDYRGSWMHLANRDWYNVHVPIAYRDLAVSAMTAAETSRDATLLWALHARIVNDLRQAPATPDAVEPVAIYMWTDASGVPIYYGITKDMHSRQTTHARYGAWGVFAASCTVERRPSRDEALAFERELIERDRPIFNRQHNDSPAARQRLVEYLAASGRLDLLSKRPAAN